MERKPLLTGLADALESVAKRFSRSCNLSRIDGLNEEYSQLYESAGWGNLTVEQQQRADEIHQELTSLTHPPEPLEIEHLYKDFCVEQMIVWLKVQASVEFAAELEERIKSPLHRFYALNFKATKIINGDPPEATETHGVKYACRRLIDCHYELVRKMFEGADRAPERADLPAEMREIDEQILDEYYAIAQEFLSLSRYLRHTAAALKVKNGAKSPDADGIQPTNTKKPANQEGLFIGDISQKPRDVVKAIETLALYRFDHNDDKECLAERLFENEETPKKKAASMMQRVHYAQVGRKAESGRKPQPAWTTLPKRDAANQQTSDAE